MNKGIDAQEILQIRQDFPLFRNDPVIYLDNSATTQKPDAVLNAVSEFYGHDNANPFRGIYDLSERATERYEAARETVSKFIHAESPSEIVFTRNASESLNLAANCLAELLLQPGDEVIVTDVGILTDTHCPAVRDRKIRHGTEDLAVRPAMLRSEAVQAISVGIETVREAKAAGLTAVGIGEMGIGNTTTSSAVLCALTGASVADVTGRGGGLTDEGYQKKLAVIEAALALHRPDANDPIDVLTKVGGLDLAAMTGAYLGCAAEHIPAVVDGFISIVAALCAVRLCPAARDYLILAHASYEIGYRIAAEELRQEPCLLLEMRLGEGSGCPLMFQIMRAACAVLCEMATFEEASIHDGSLDEIRKTDAFTVARP